MPRSMLQVGFVAGQRIFPGVDFDRYYRPVLRARREDPVSRLNLPRSGRSRRAG
jgi:hypothetical protein